MVECDRCGRSEEHYDLVLMETCSICGPTLLCRECLEVHKGDLDIENQQYIPPGYTIINGELVED